MTTSSRCSRFCNTAIVLSIIVLVNTWPGLTDLLIVDENCDQQATLFYEDIGCKPKFKEGKWCPISYDCGNLTRLNNACRLRGKLYQAGDGADGLIQGHACQEACTCRQRPNAPAEFLCGILDCPEWLGTPPLKPGCHRKYDLHQCCSAGVICDGNITTCKYMGKSYMDGDKIYLNEYCVKCICQQGFAIGEKADEPFCARMRCGVELKHADKLERYCAPAYIATPYEKICCPDSFVCPSDEEIEIRDGEVSDVGKCKFGDKSYNLGATFNQSIYVYRKVRHFKCDCRIPPFFTCLERILNTIT